MRLVKTIGDAAMFVSPDPAPLVEVALTLAPPSAVVPFNYLSLVWATLLGLAIWGDVPTPHLLLGAAVVVASGLYILWRETVRRKHPLPPRAAPLKKPVTSA